MMHAGGPVIDVLAAAQLAEAGKTDPYFHVAPARGRWRRPPAAPS